VPGAQLTQLVGVAGVVLDQHEVEREALAGQPHRLDQLVESTVALGEAVVDQPHPAVVLLMRLGHRHRLRRVVGDEHRVEPPLGAVALGDWLADGDRRRDRHFGVGRVAAQQRLDRRFDEDAPGRPVLALERRVLVGVEHHLAADPPGRLDRDRQSDEVVRVEGVGAARHRVAQRRARLRRDRVPGRIGTAVQLPGRVGGVAHQP